MSNVASRTYKKKAWNELVGPALQRPAKSQKGASKATLRNGETAWCRGFTCTNFRPPFGGLRGQTLRPEPTKKRLGMSLSAQHYQDQHRGKSHPPKRENSMVSRVHVHPFSASVWRAAMSNVASRTYKKRLGMSLSAQHYKDQHRGRKGRQKPPSETRKQHGVAGSRAPIFGLRLEGCEVKRCVQNLQKKAWNELVGPTLPRPPAKSQKGASKAILRNGETAWCRGFTCTHFRPPFGGLRGQTLRPEPTKKRLGMSLSAQHYQDQHRGRKGRQKPPSETATQHGVAGSRAPIFGLRLECCDVKRRVQNLQKKGLE